MNIYLALFILACVITLAGYLWMVVTGFKRSVLWGVLVTLLYPLTAIIFAATNWFDARKPFIVYVVSMLMLIGTGWAIYIEVGTRNASQIAARLHSGKLDPGEAFGLVRKALNHVGPIDLFAEELKQAAAGQTTGNASSEQMADAVKTAVTPTEITQAPVPAPEEQSPPAETETAAVKPEAAEPAKSEAAEKKASTTEPETEATNKEAEEPAAPKYPTPDLVQPDPLVPKKKKEEPKSIEVSVSKLPKYIGHYFIITMKKGHEQRGLLVKINDTTLVLNRKLYGGNFEYRISKSQIKSIHMLTKIPEER